MNYWRAVLLVAARDLKVELRSREQAVTLLFFALLVLVVFNFAFDFTVIDFVTLGSGVLWVAFIFSGVVVTISIWRLRLSCSLSTNSACDGSSIATTRMSRT